MKERIMEEEKPPYKKPSLKSAPRIRQILACRFPNGAAAFPNGAILPEFYKMRPVLIISKKARLDGIVTILPLTTSPQNSNPAAYKIISGITPKQSWIICNYITSVSVARLSAERRIVPYLPEGEFAQVLALMHSFLPQA
ncbi:type II toxin-antitoxin system PemK/MazF family toxin [Candidatus Tokpelaia sp.]|uniref:type II toxin-antitoxin system PemK/MazF family toxin n=1 Tax=Candidatus Tokpelaia sp. TaxID=2233777 RepID=UPI001238A3B2|nr:type II toxin-antitoxin system PemK/MazF family toxin [Candidatus Tokpelaia sp.]KAA6406198.1 type II toxin-antitoxin system PemK/MazF family toxin [Candidatus Tokpelaia sp.]